MKKNVLLVAIFLFAILGLHSCSDDNPENTSRVQLKLIDAPGDYQEVNVEIIDVLYNSTEDDEGWKSITEEDFSPIIVDLTELIAGNELLLSDVIIPSGMLQQIRLVLGDNNTLLVEGEANPINLDTPSGQQSGLKLKTNTELEPGYSYTFILDWDVQKSVVKAGNSGKYNLKPVIRVNTEVNSGSIKGKVVGKPIEGDNLADAIPLEGASVTVYTMDNVEVTETATNSEGNFIVRGLDPGEYKIKIEDFNYIIYESQTIEVTAGETTDAGTIELSVPVS
ncbi:DUF4382 domain-containing protein [Lutimonas zeaxanthinifaciens]|uniref:DUF4382 domain-containing protein n=1 Tax=Lutimonas zeaxanthinifaciens TaxID=3060215 RepID=UPI00265D1D0D|nr:DUF4382 domain-containing protein [Lutimonas sp. YSD2104]WKK66345.1 DUF4382 domain-containing protein [Lutimonas sp. YSD2104]